MTTGCYTCDLHDKPMICEAGTMADQHADLHRAFHDMWRQAVTAMTPTVNRLNRLLTRQS